MVKFCTNCGNRLEDNDYFCTKCGTKIEKVRKTKNMSKKEIKQAKQSLKKITGGVLPNPNFTKKLKSHKLTTMDGENIKKQIIKEIESETVSSEDVENRIDELVREYWKKNLKHSVNLDGTRKEYKQKEGESYNDYLNRINPSLKDTSITDEEIELMSSEYLKNKEKVDPYDFACSLLEDGGFENRGHFTEHKRLWKKRDLETNVFIKLMDNRIEMFASDVYPEKKLLSPTTIQSGNRVIFFSEINNIVFEKNQITLNLQNHDKLRLVSRDYSKTGKEKLQKFSELLKEKWMNYKENESVMGISKNEQPENNTTDELMRIAELYEKGLLTEEEFSAMKKKLLGL